VHHCVRALEQWLKVICAQIGLNKGEAWPHLQRRQVALLEGARVVGDKRVKANNSMAVGQQRRTEVRANESGRAGD